MIIKNHTLIEVEEGDIVNGTCLLPKDITSIDDNAFGWCITLKNITLPESLASIGNSAFARCENLESITLPKGVTNISNYVFGWCENLKSIILPDSITSISNSAFRWCVNLRNITLSKKITSIGDYAFWECGNLESIILPEKITSIGNYVFGECENLKNITLPEGLTDIGDSAFWGCEKLESITIPDKVTNIGNSAFDGCKNLKHIQWGKTAYHVTYIDGMCMNILNQKKLGVYIIYKCQYFPTLGKTVWAAEKDGITAHGTSIKDAIRDVEFKLLENRDISEHIARIKSQGYVTPMDYRLITGACEAGTGEFLKRKNLSWNDRRTIKETIELTKNEYGHETFVKALEECGCI